MQKTRNRWTAALLALAVLIPFAAVQAAPSTHQEHVHADDLDAAIENAIERVMASMPAAQVVPVPVEVPVEVEKIETIVERIAGEAGFGFGADTSGGCGLPSFHLDFEGRVDNLDSHAYVAGGGNLACKFATRADIGVEADFGHLSLEFGYDRRPVSVQEVNEKGRVVFYGAVVAETAAANYDFDALGGNWEIGATVLPKPSPRVAYSVKVGGFDVDVDATRFPSHGTLSSIRVSRDFALANGWAVEVFGTRTHGLDKVPDPVDWKNDAGLDRGPGAPPNRAHSYGVTFKHAFGE